MSYELHEPTFDGTTSERWVEPDWDALAESDPESVADHFLLCAGGFPPESLDDLELPVVDENGRLNQNALANVLRGGDDVEALDLSEDVADAVEDRCRELLSEHFDSMPEPEGDVDGEPLAWREQREEHEHDVEQKMHTDDQQRHGDVKQEQVEDGEERPETGR